MGHIAKARLEEQNKQTVIYDYFCINQNIPGWQEHKDAYDGKIMIVLPDSDKTEFGTDDCLVKNAGGTWEMDENGKDRSAWALIDKIREECRKTGKFPKIMQYNT